MGLGAHNGSVVIWEPGCDYDLTRSLGVISRGMGDTTVRIRHDAAWLAFHTGSGPATIEVRQHGTQLHARSWGSGRDEALATAPALLGAFDDWSDFDHPEFARTLPERVAHTRRRNPGVRLPHTGRMLDSVVPAILEQKVTSLEARRGFAILLRKFGSPAPGAGTIPGVPPELTLPPTATDWARIPSWEWHKAGVGPQRSATVMRVLHELPGLERLSTLSAVEASTRLESIRGIGPWTAAEVVQRTHGSADHISVGDYHLASYVGWALKGSPVDDDGMLELLQPWSGHRQRIIRMLVLSGFRKPRFGPKMTVQDHRRH